MYLGYFQSRRTIKIPYTFSQLKHFKEFVLGILTVFGGFFVFLQPIGPHHAVILLLDNFFSTCKSLPAYKSSLITVLICLPDLDTSSQTPQ